MLSIFFSTSWRNDQTPMALGETLNNRGVKRLFLLAPNYAAGKDMAAGVKKTSRAKSSTKNIPAGPGTRFFGGTDLRFVRPSRMRVGAFYSGQAGAEIMQQDAQAGLKRQHPDLQRVHGRRAHASPDQGAGAGPSIPQQWVQDLDNDVNKRFVADFRKKYGRYPSYYSAQHYDAGMLINSAVVALKGDLSNKDAVRDALRKADFKSVRGSFRYNHNHFPIQNFYLQEVVKDDAGEFTDEEPRAGSGKTAPTPIPTNAA